MQVLIKCTKLERRDSPKCERLMQSMQSLRRRNHKMHFKLHFPPRASLSGKRWKDVPFDGMLIAHTREMVYKGHREKRV